MPFTNPWSTTVPAGSEPAKTIDDHIRRLRVDIAERMAQLFVNFANDPLVLADLVLGKKTGKKLFVPFCDFVVEAGESVNYDASGCFIVSAAAQPVRAPLKLPVGVVIKQIRWLVASDDSNTVTMSLKSKPFTTSGSASSLNTQTKASSGTEIKDSGAISFTVDGTAYMWLEIEKTTGAQFKIYAAEITYDAADARSTM